MKRCEACGHTGALFAGATSGPPVVRCARCIEPLRPWVGRVWLHESGPSVPGVVRVSVDGPRWSVLVFGNGSPPRPGWNGTGVEVRDGS